jgi:hypothetical protein
MEKSANKKWKESGTTLTFKEWIERENQKKEPEGNFIPFDATPTSNSNVVQEILDSSKQSIEETAGYKTPEKANPNLVLGLDKKILIFSSLLIVGSLAYYFYDRLKKKK